MNKEELIKAIKEAKGIKDEGKVVKPVNVRELKEKALAARAKKLEAIAAGEPTRRSTSCARRPTA